MTKRRKYLEENAGVLDIILTASDLTGIEALLARFPDIGLRDAENLAN